MSVAGAGVFSWWAPAFPTTFAAAMMTRRPAQQRRQDEPRADAELIEWALGGDPSAFDALYRRYVDAVWGRLTRLVGPDPEREDLTQQIFMEVFRGLGRFRGDASFRTYLGQIAVHVACDHLGRRRRRPQPISDEIMETLTATDASPEVRAEQRQRLRLTWSVLDRVKPKKRIAFILRTVEEMSLEEVAELVGASVSTVAKRVKHAEDEVVRLLAHRTRDSSSGRLQSRGQQP